MTKNPDASLGGQRHILLGQITGAHGIRGDVIVRTYTGDPADIASYGPLTDSKGQQPLTLTVVRVSEKGVVARIKGVADRNAAEALRGRELYVLRDALPATDEAEFYHADLIGLTAYTADQSLYGNVVAVQNFGAGDLLEIRLEAGKDIEFIPFTNACVPDVDLRAGRLTVVPPIMTGDPEPAIAEAGADEAED
jgi:16S rRNA processing protein RimM